MMTSNADIIQKLNPSDATLPLLLFGQSILLLYLWKSHSQITQQLSEARSTSEKQAELRAVERAGRISVQQAKRQVKNESIRENGYSYRAIGVVESPFPDRRGTPRQPSLVPAAKGKIRFDRKLIQKDHFQELSQFSHVWVLFVFHNNTNTEKDSLAAKIKPPRLHGVKVGCLSTRSPHRPNNIGLSVCEVVSVGDDFLELRCMDMVNGTPVLDVKPYIPYDVVPSLYNLPMATSSQGSALPARELRVPAWVVDADIPMLPVVIPQNVLGKLEEDLAMQNRKAACCFGLEEAVELITQVLRQDIRGVHQGRGTTADSSLGPNSSTSSDDNSSSSGNGNGNGYCNTSSNISLSTVYKCTLDGMEISFTTTVTGITVHSIHILIQE